MDNTSTISMKHAFRGIRPPQKDFRTTTVLCAIFDIISFDYRNTKLVIGIDTEKVLEAICVLLNTHAHDLLTVNCKYARPTAGGAVNQERCADLMHILLRSDHILEVQDASVRVFDWSIGFVLSLSLSLV